MNCDEYTKKLNEHKLYVNNFCMKNNNYINKDICFIYDNKNINDNDRYLAKKQVIRCLNENNTKCSKLLENDITKKNLVFENNVRLVLLAGLFLVL